MSDLTIWNDPTELRKNTSIVPKELTTTEFNVFMEIGKALSLNPFMREIWAVKYGNNPASIFVGRDGYRKRAQSIPEYSGHIVDVVHENDEFSMSNGEVHHVYSVKNRGDIIGAYCVVYRKNTVVPFYVFADINEYSTGKSLWASKPATMIKKVAEAQALRGAFQSYFAGTYDESEQWEQKKPIKTPVEVVENPVKHEKHVKQPEALPDQERAPLGDPDQLYDTIEKLLASCIESGTVHKSEVSKLTDSITKAYESGDVKQLLSYKAQLEGRGQSSAAEKSGDSNEILILRKRILKGFGLLNYNEVHMQNSIKKHLEVDNINDCHDVEKLRKLLDKLLFENDKKPAGTASQKQKNFIKMLCNSDEAMIDENLPEGVESIDQLTKEQASEMIARLQK